MFKKTCERRFFANKNKNDKSFCPTRDSKNVSLTPRPFESPRRSAHEKHLFASVYLLKFDLVGGFEFIYFLKKEKEKKSFFKKTRRSSPTFVRSHPFSARTTIPAGAEELRPPVTHQGSPAHGTPRQTRGASHHRARAERASLCQEPRPQNSPLLGANQRRTRLTRRTKGLCSMGTADPENSW